MPRKFPLSLQNSYHFPASAGLELQTERHPTFEPVAYDQVRSLILQHVPPAEQERVQQAIERRFFAENASRSPQDVYYAGWVRLGDTNVTMRLRDWRPQGEVIAPWAWRQQMAAEVAAEAKHYSGDPWNNSIHKI